MGNLIASDTNHNLVLPKRKYQPHQLHQLVTTQGVRELNPLVFVKAIEISRTIHLWISLSPQMNRLRGDWGFYCTAFDEILHFEMDDRYRFRVSQELYFVARNLML